MSRLHPNLTRLAAAIACSAVPAIAQSNLSSFWGSTASQHLGVSVDRIGDINADGYADMVVGSPDINGTGAVYFVSGYYLKTGNGFASLGATFGSNAGGRMGASVMGLLADVTGDGVQDVLVGEPGVGDVHLVSGATKTIVKTLHYGPRVYGECIAPAGDPDGDGYPDAVLGFPNSANGGGIEIVSPRKLYVNANHSLGLKTGLTGVGTSVSSGVVTNLGQINFITGDPIHNVVWVTYLGAVAPYSIVGDTGSGFGSSVDASRDFDGDGYCDILVGAPGAGLVYLLSGYVIAHGPGSTTLAAVLTATLGNGQTSSLFGKALTTTSDLNADGVPEIVVGAPGYDTIFPVGSNRGAVHVFSGRTLTQIGSALGASSGDQLGASVSRSWDYDLDGRQEFAVGSPYSNFGAVDAGIVRIYSLYPAIPRSYCVGKVNSLGCTPGITFSGSPSLTSASAFNLSVSNMINNKPGMLLYGYAPDSAAFQGGTLCLKSPIRRVGVQSTTGNPPPNDCSGHMTYDFNARIQSGADPALLVAGKEVCCQFWSRDPQDPNGSSLSNALSFLVNP